MKLNIYIKRILFLIILQFSVCGLFAQNSSLKEAESAYSNGDYKEAIKLYESVLKSNGPSADVYYNLGNSYYKTDEIASAILNYERALKIDPSDGDARFNLQMAHQKTVDKIEPAGDMFLSGMFTSVQDICDANGWGTIGILCFIILLICSIMFFFSKWIYLKKIGFYGGLFMIVIIIFANIFGQRQKNKLTIHDSAIIFTPTVTIKSSPDASGNDLFILHEGTKVHIQNKLGEWSEIKMDDGSTGWLPNKDFQII